MPTDCEIEMPAAPASPEARAQVPPSAGENTYGQILKSSALIGGSSALNIVVGIIRTKAMAVLLAPAGFGLFGIYGSIANLTQCLAGMGINSSGVRQIAHAAGSDDLARIAQTASVLRRVSIMLGVFGAILLAVFSRQVSTLTFGSAQHAGAISLLSLAVLFQTISNGQGALVQGMRRIFDLAKIGVLGAVFGTLIAIPLIYFLRERGVVPSLVGVGLMSLCVSWWYSRKVRIRTVSLSLSQFREETSGLFKLGLAFMASGLMTMGMAYAIRIILLRKIGVEATGLYQSAWTLGGALCWFHPTGHGGGRLTALTANAEDNAVCNRLVNEQTQAGLCSQDPGS